MSERAKKKIVLNIEMTKEIELEVGPNGIDKDAEYLAGVHTRALQREGYVIHSSWVDKLNPEPPPRTTWLPKEVREGLETKKQNE